MCHGDSTRTALGGTIAILKPVRNLEPASRPTLRREISLRLIAEDQEGTTKAIITGLDEGEKIGSRVLIQYVADP